MRENRMQIRLRRRFPQHFCELVFTSDRVHKKLPPFASPWAHFAFWLKFQIQAWRRHPVLRMLRHSNYAIEMEQASHLLSNYWWLIHPFSRFWTYWTLIMIIANSMVLFFFPFDRTFLHFNRYVSSSSKISPWNDGSEQGNRFQRHLIEGRLIIRSILSVADAFFYIHVILKFFTGFYDIQLNKIVMKQRLIIIKYIKTTFILDILSVLPTINQLEAIIFQTNAVMIDYSLPQHRRLLYIFTFIAFMRLLRLYDTIKYIKFWCDFMSSEFVIKYCVIFMYLYFILIQWGVFFFVRVSYLVQGARIFESDSHSWLADHFSKYLNINVSYPILRQYVVAMERVLRAAQAYSPSSLLPSLNVEDLLTMLLAMWISKLFAVAILTLIMFSAKKKYYTNAKLDTIRHNLKMFRWQRKLPHKLYNRILLYYFKRFETDDYYNEREFLATLTRNVRQSLQIARCSEIEWTEMFRKLVTASSLFRSMPKILINAIAANLVEEMYLPHDVIYSYGSEATYLYFLSIGTVAIYLRTGEEVGHLVDSDYFGDMGVVLSEHGGERIETVVALEKCEIFKLHRKVFKKLLKPLPRLYARIRAAAIHRAIDITPLFYEDFMVHSLMDSMHSFETNSSLNFPEWKLESLSESSGSEMTDDGVEQTRT